jgi:16S rRNA A1518/A1519 N6-dimethyltransferase RsmA/KsgA/DIM1 with predicted DNA glycosylase/AP lyase activity
VAQSDWQETPEPNVHSFVIKLQLEEIDERERKTVWRGYITHVPSGERRYVKDLSGITSFIEQCLAATGAQVNQGSRLWQWLNRWRRVSRSH